jgi:hypothetical protein
MTLIFFGHEVHKPAARAAVIATMPLGFAWMAFWMVTTLPLHVALRVVGGNGFTNPRTSEYRVPVWAMLPFLALLVVSILAGA